MKKAKKGFTLVELMVVIVIMAVLAAAATPVFAGYVKKARAAEHLSECRAIYVAAQSCLEEAFLKAGEGTVTVEDLDMERFLKDVEELSGVGGIGSGEGTPGSGGSAGTFSIYLENGRDGANGRAGTFPPPDRERRTPALACRHDHGACRLQTTAPKGPGRMFSVSSRALAFSAASRSTAHHPAPKTPTGRPFRDGPSSSSADTPAPQTQKAPDALASGAYMPWWVVRGSNLRLSA